jgi:hypothetical protein
MASSPELGQRVVDAVGSGASRREGQHQAGALLYFTNLDEAKLAKIAKAKPTR